MILVDTNIWIDHFRVRDEVLFAMLADDRVLIHPFVLGELALGNLGNRSILRDLQDIPKSPIITHEEFQKFVVARRLMGRGIGFVDAHLLASVTAEHELRLWTRDKRLNALAEELGVAAKVLN